MDVFKKGGIATFAAVMRWRCMQRCCCFGRCYGNAEPRSPVDPGTHPICGPMWLRRRPLNHSMCNSSVLACDCFTCRVLLVRNTACTIGARSSVVEANICWVLPSLH